MVDYTTEPTETLTLGDTYSRVWNATETYSETLNFTDTFTYDWTLERIYSETLTLADVINHGFFSELTETITLTDTATPKLTARILLETLTFSDTYSRVWDATPIYLETFTLTDTLTPCTGICLEETITLTDSHIRGKIFFETMTLSDGDITGTDQLIKSTNGAWCGIFSSRISLETSVQNFINALDAQQIPINMVKFSCHAVIAEESVVEYNLVAIIKKH